MRQHVRTSSPRALVATRLVAVTGGTTATTGKVELNVEKIERLIAR